MATLVNKLHTKVKATLRRRLWMANTKIKPLLHPKKDQWTVHTAVGQCTLCTTALSSTWYPLLPCPGGSVTSLTPPTDPHIQTRMNLFKPKLTTPRRIGAIRDLINMGKLFCWVAVLTNLLLKPRSKLKHLIWQPFSLNPSCMPFGVVPHNLASRAHVTLTNHNVLLRFQT